MEKFPNYGYALYKEKNIVIPILDGKPLVPGLWDIPIGEYLLVHHKKCKSHNSSSVSKIVK